MTLPSELQQIFPERNSDLSTLYSLLACKSSPSPNIVVWGSRRTSKSDLVRALLDHFKRPYAWLSCTATSQVDKMIARIATSLASDEDKALHNNLTPARFLRALPKLCPLDGPDCRLVVENPDRLTNLDFLKMLMRLEDQPDVRLSVIFIADSPTSWVPDGVSVPLALQFETYTIQEMTSIINRLLPVDKTREELTKTFINNVIRTIMSCTCDVNTLKTCLDYLVKKFWQPVEDEIPGISEMNANVMPHVFSVLKCLNTAPISNLDEALRSLETNKRKGINRPVSNIGLHSTGLPVYSKVLLIAGFICSHNHASTDQSFFDESHKTIKRRRTSVSTNKPKKSIYTFDFERLFLVSTRIMKQIDESEPISAMYSCGFANQFVTLETFGFFKMIGSDPLKPAKYLCTIDLDFATKLSDGLRLNLPDFLDKCN